MPPRPIASKRSLLVPAALLLAGGIAILAPSSRAATTTPGRHVITSDKVKVSNVLGTVTILPADGRDVIVEVAAGGPDAARLRVAVDDCEGGKHLRVVYPSELVVDPEMHRGSSRQVHFDGCPHERHVRFVRPGDGGVEAHADVTIRVPKHQKLHVEMAKGDVDVSKTTADLTIETGRGEVTARGIVGSASVETGAGTVRVEGARGTVSLESGSGELEANDVDGSLTMETGSGGISLARVRASKVALASGSGGITASDVVAARFDAECGSGRIEVAALNAPRASMESGSGGVAVDLSRSPESLRIATGSGGVTLTTPRNLDARLDIECDKRHLEIDFPVEIETQSGGRLRGRVGSGAGEIEIGTGSGRVELKARSS